MEHVLDNPAWNALNSGNKELAHGNELVKYFDGEVSPFVGLAENSESNFRMLYELLDRESPILFVAVKETTIPAPWKQLVYMKGFQMVFQGHAPTYAPKYELKDLTDEHVPQMLELTKLTNPGPFASRTIEFGHYKGIFDGDKLIAMAGHRLHPNDYTEISAVCTHPDYLGKGYARELLLYHINHIKANNGIPFLHVRFNNERAIDVYEKIGFRTRTEVYFYVLQKDKQQDA